MKTTKNFTEGKLFRPILMFALPIILTNVLQTMYNIADHVVVGKFSGDALALAAIGTSSSISTLFLNIVIGVSVGASVVVAHAYGAGERERISKSVHTALTFGFLFGLLMAIVSIALTRPMLILTDVSEELIDKATLYLIIIFAALPATAVYNFSASALRAVGDSRTSLWILTLSGLLNVVLNLIFVICFGMSVGGVALATAISKYASAIAMVIILIHRKSEPYALSLKKLGITHPILLRMLRYGVPNSIQNSMFSISNVLLTSAINTFETYVLSARTIAINMMNICNNVAAGYTNASLTCAGQNFGAQKYPRIKRSLLITVLQASVLTFTVGMLCLLLCEPLSAMYVQASDPAKDAIFASVKAISTVTLPFYFIASIMNSLSGTLRGMGASLSPMLISVFGICGFRTLWIYTAFRHPLLHSAEGLYLSYSLSWTLVILGLLVVFTCIWRRLPKPRSEQEGT